MNQQIFYFFYSLAHRGEFLNQVIYFLGHYLPVITVFGAFLFLLWHQEVLPSHNPVQEFKAKWREISAVFISALTAWILARVLKIVIHLDRPFTGLENVQALIDKNDFAFPSGHATFFFALATMIFFHHRHAGIVFFALASLVSLARIAAGVHYPVDILGGVILGIAIAYFLRSR